MTKEINIKKIIWFVAFLPLLYIIYKLSWGFEYPRYVASFIYEQGGSFLGKFPNDPLKFIADLLGITAIQFLIATLTLTPLRMYLKINLIKYRRLIGLWTFAYAFMHSLFFFISDNEGNVKMMIEDAYKRPFVFFGLAAFLILFMMALTSHKKLFPKFLKWHKLVYLAAVFISLHYMMSQKIIGLDAASYVGVLVMLLVLRLLKR
ncbi:ferric reductase-like transmembrane domain-containing protein [Sulfurimonas sp. MAG313]|nr:ferric reductase-like transmembrane domain-containing protein [Sulfurimonas sp. MAG313]MDF1881066.1 ferric reductase-like transmembrane domain-containing protein [Sulfurimonas sp. MAG313]